MGVCITESLCCTPEKTQHCKFTTILKNGYKKGFDISNNCSWSMSVFLGKLLPGISCIIFDCLCNPFFFQCLGTKKSICDVEIIIE